MSERKTEVVNLRMAPSVKELLRLAAAHERRTLSNMLEVLIEDYCQAKGLGVPGGPERIEKEMTSTPH
jgi:CopG-like RHH_1 or ribbon-helix-helix domain, RHH_5